jgi:uncharacterized protein YjbI with pentapeptide repeats
MTNTGFSGAFLTMADLRGADLTGARMTDADLRGADLRNANLRGAVLEGSDLGPVYIETKTTQTGNLRSPTRIEMANLENASCESVDFSQVDIGAGVLGQPKSKTKLKIAEPVT